MRKAAGLARKGVRRKHQQQHQQQKDDQSGSYVSSDSSPAEKRKPQTEEEAVLTAKNYRLAKELSDLRVRHREETKNVTRLTMENMNLASRCREAISHVAMLKKELAIHQRRAAEALALQRQQQQRMTVSLPTSEQRLPSTEVAMEMDRMDRILAAHAPPPPPPPPSKNEPLQQPQDEDSPKGEFFADFNGEKPTSKQLNRGTSAESIPSTPPSNDDDDETLESGLANLPQKEMFPHSASPRIVMEKRKNLEYNEGFPDDLPARRPTPKFRTSPGITESDSESVSSATTSSPKPRNAKDIMSSIDAFEASFNTAFPANFSSNNEAEKKPSIYNPFFAASPARSTSSIDSSTTPSMPVNLDNEEEPSTSVQERIAIAKSTPPPKNRGIDVQYKTPPVVPDPRKSEDPPARYESPGHSNDNLPTPTNTLTRAKSVPHRLFPATIPKDEDEDRDPAGLRTPPRPMNKTTDDVEQPRRPEKTVTASARARYESALQPRTFSGTRSATSSGRVESTTLAPANPTTPEKSAGSGEQLTKKTPKNESTSHAPSMVLKRLQQRRVKERMAVETAAVAASPLTTKSPSKAAASSPSVASVVSSYEAATKKKEDGRSTHWKSNARAARNPSPHYPPSDEDDTPSTRGQERARELQQLARRTAENGVRKPLDINGELPFTSKLSGPRSLTAETMSAEIRNLDAMASAYPQPPVSGSPVATTGRFTATGKVKRNIRQPISYAEPSLNSKLRRGDVYFPKEQEDAEDILNDLANPVRS